MAGNIQTLDRMAGHDAQALLTGRKVDAEPCRSEESIAGERRLASGWWILPSVGLGIAGWILIIRAAWGWLA